METVNGKFPITNTRVNPSLTLEEALKFSTTEQLRIVSALNSHLSSVDLKELFEQLPDDQKADHKMMVQDPTKWLQIYWKHRERLLAQFKSSKGKEDFANGQKIFQALVDCNIHGRLRMNMNQLLGYIKARGSWNDFRIPQVSDAIKASDNIIPRKDYGINNCNTGDYQHEWMVDGATLLIKVGYLGRKETNVLDCKDQLQTIWKEAGADRFRHEIEYDNVTSLPAYLYFIIWWD